jgi:hypothetical protein
LSSHDLKLLSEYGAADDACCHCASDCQAGGEQRRKQSQGTQSEPNQEGGGDEPTPASRDPRCRCDGSRSPTQCQRWPWCQKNHRLPPSSWFRIGNETLHVSHPSSSSDSAGAPTLSTPDHPSRTHDNIPTCAGRLVAQIVAQQTLRIYDAVDTRARSPCDRNETRLTSRTVMVRGRGEIGVNITGIRLTTSTSQERTQKRGG